MEEDAKPRYGPEWRSTGAGMDSWSEPPRAFVTLMRGIVSSQIQRGLLWVEHYTHLKIMRLPDDLIHLAPDNNISDQVTQRPAHSPLHQRHLPLFQNRDAPSAEPTVVPV